MNTRERTLAVVLLSVIILMAGGFLVLKFLIEPWRERSNSISLLRQEIDTKRKEVLKVQAEKAKLQHWRQLSLPADADLASREYEKYLGELLRRSKFEAGSFTVKAAIDTKTSPTLAGKKKEPIYTKLTFTVNAPGELSSLAAFLERFYRTGLLHQIKKLSIQRPRTVTADQKPNQLNVDMTIEALVLQDAENRPYLPPIQQQLVALEALTSLRRGPSGLALIPATVGPAGPLGAGHLATQPRQYASIQAKNIFYGPPPALPAVVEKPAPVDKTDVMQFVYLTDITHSENNTEAWLFDRFTPRKHRLRNSTGYDRFIISNAQGETLVSAQVIRIDDRDVFFKANDKYYAFHVGASLREAMAKPLKEEELKNLGILPNNIEKLPPPKETDAKPEPGPP